MDSEILIENKDTKISMQRTKKGRKPTRKRRKGLVYFNPPFNYDVRTNIGKLFFEALDNNFPRKHKYYPWLNRHTVKLAYSTVPNLGRIIAGINGKKRSIELRNKAGSTGVNHNLDRINNLPLSIRICQDSAVQRLHKPPFPE